ncbi:MAG: hypothetical protein LBR06_08530 [Bacteroidales bacterium]|jgi:hypothetical protein|nr:hypothetical protein [Bacteroidales bacterium]
MRIINLFLVGLSCLWAGQAFSQTPKELHDFLPAIDGWTVAPETEVFNADNLYERINGAAPLFIENNFREMTSLTCTKGDDYITVQAYRHATPEDAFGMYASERASDMTHYEGIGGEAQGDDYGLFFFAGSIYVKMSCNVGSHADVMQTIARGFAAKIAPDAAYPAVFAAFPEEGKILHSEVYITQNFIGHEFLKPVYAANYTAAAVEFQLFVIDGKTEAGALQILKQYATFAKYTGKLKQGAITIADRYNGNIPLVWTGRYIVGTFSEKAADLPAATTLINKTAKQLKKVK